VRRLLWWLYFGIGNLGAGGVERSCISRKCHFAEIHNIVKACKHCNSSKGDKDLFAWYGEENKDKIPRLVLGKYLKLVYRCHECRGTLESTDINSYGKLNVLDLGIIFVQLCTKN
jgi:hypothetical protein